MHWQFTPYTLPLLIVMAISAAVAFYTWQRRSAPGAKALALLMLAVAEWSLGYALELGSADLPTKIFWAKVQYLGIVILPVMWLAFALQYTGREKWLTRRNVVMLVMAPFVTLLLVWTNDVHRLFYSSIRLDTSGSFSALDLTYGAWFWVNTAYSYLLLLLGTFLLIQAVIRSPHLYRGQASALVVGALAPWVGNALYISGLSPFPHLDLTPFAFTLTGLAMAWGLFRYRLLDIVPVARDAVVENMSDVVIVLDGQNRIVDLNPAAQQVIGRVASEVIGQPAAQVLSDWPDLVERYRDVTEAHSEIVLGEGEAQRTFDLRISPLHNRRGRLTGCLVVLRDVTERKWAEEALKRRNRELTMLYEAATATSSNLSLDTVLQAVAEQLTQALDSRGCALSLWDREGGLVRTLVDYSVDWSDGTESLGTTYDLNDYPATRSVLETRRPVVVQYGDPTADEAESAWMEKEEVQTLLMLPLIARDQVLGLVELLDETEARDYTPEEIRLAQSMAAQAAIAIENARLYEQAQQEITERKQAEDLLCIQRDLGMALSSTTNLSEALDRLLEATFQIEGIDCGGVYVVDRLTGELDLISRAGLPLQFVESASHYAADSPQARLVMAGEPIYRRYSEVLPEARDKVRRRASLRALAVVPVQYEGQVVAALNLASHTHDEIPFGARNALEAIAAQIGGVIARVRAEEALRESEEKLRHLFESATDGIFAMDLNGTYTEVNQRELEMHGLSSRDEILGKSGFEFVAPHDIERAMAGMKEVLEQGAVVRQEFTALKADGFEFPIEVSGAVLKDASGNPVGIIGITRDITERKRAEEALRKAHDELEIRVEERTAELAKANKELQAEITERQWAEAALEKERALLARRVEERTAELSAANAELARAARLKDEFLASMSHELRTPLNAVLGLSEALQEQVYGPLNERQHKSLRSIEESGRHLLALINDILDVSKIEAGKLELETGPVSVESVCQASLGLIKQAAHKKQLKVSSTFDSAVTTLQADERRLKQILVNLLSNAVKFTPEGGAVGLEVAGDAEREVVHFTIWDTGIGISPEEMERLFQPFVQLDSSLSRQYTGTGLGLALVRRLTELHGGGVSVESEVGKGSRFTVSLPWQAPAGAVEPVGESELAEAGTPLAVAAIQTPGAKQPLILLAEDNEDSIHIFSDYLLAKGYRVVVARDGAEAIERAREERPELIVMDIQMPGMDGLEATRRLRADAAQSVATVPIIALTALAMPGDRERCLAAGANEYLSKPVSLKELVQVIEVQLNRNQIGKGDLT